MTYFERKVTFHSDDLACYLRCKYKPEQFKRISRAIFGNKRNIFYLPGLRESLSFDDYGTDHNRIFYQSVFSINVH